MADGYTKMVKYLKEQKKIFKKMVKNHLLNFSQIRIENTNLCTYKCLMCPREKMKRKKGIMSFDNFKYILDSYDSFEKELHLQIKKKQIG